MKWKGLSEDGKTITLHKFTGQFNVPMEIPSENVQASPLEAEQASFQTFIQNYETQEEQTEFLGLLGGPAPVVSAPLVSVLSVNRDLRKDLGEDFGIGATTDVETTGLDVKIENVIEIGIRVFRFNKKTGEILAVVDSYSALQDPGRPLTPVIQELTGLTDEALKGHSIDWGRVKNIFDQCDIIVAHNAAFDRPFIEKELGISMQKLWACSLKQVDWAAKGYGVRSLEILCAFHGFFADAHRALVDSDVLLHLLSFQDEKTGRPYFAELLTTSSTQQARLIASGAPFESKTILRDRGYRWDTQIRAWTKYLPLDSSPTEVDWLEKEVYLGPFRGQIKEIPLNQQFQGL